MGENAALFAAVFGGVGLCFLIYAVFPRAVLTLDEEYKHAESSRQGFLRAISPFLTMLTEQTVSIRGKRIDAYREVVGRRLVMGGLEDQLQSEDFIALHYFGLIIGVLCSILLGFLFWNLALAIIFIPMLGLVGLIYPKMWLDRLVRARHKQIFRALPYTLDLLTVSVEAGLDFLGGLQRVSRETPPSALREEIARMLQQMQLGKTRVEVLEQMRERVNQIDLTSVVTALVQATKLGASLGPTLRIQADTMRTKRSQQAEKLANEAPVKILFPLLLFIFPSIFIIILGPIALQAVANMTGG